ncbi:MAG: hypothetical protein ACYC1M_01620 [Armatimonadota bacterium]
MNDMQEPKLSKPAIILVIVFFVLAAIYAFLEAGGQNWEYMAPLRRLINGH